MTTGNSVVIAFGYAIASLPIVPLLLRGTLGREILPSERRPLCLPLARLPQNTLKGQRGLPAGGIRRQYKARGSQQNVRDAHPEMPEYKFFLLFVHGFSSCLFFSNVGRWR